MSGLSVVACSDNSNSGFPTVKTDSGTSGDDDDDDDDDDASVTDGGTKKDGSTGTDATTSTDASTGTDSSTGTDASSSDIYACGTPSDCPSGQNCYVTAYADWDGGNFYSSTCGLKGANGDSVCKPASAAITSDTEVCALLNDGGSTPCVTGTCQTVGIYGKNFGVCLTETGYDAGCSASRFIPYQGEPNYCFGTNTTGGPDGGCTGTDIVCCDTKVGTSFVNSCVATAAGCN